MEYEIFYSEKPKDGREITEINGIPVITPLQLHGNRVVFVGKKTNHQPKGDGLVTDKRELFIGILAADCLPIFLIGKGAVGVVHAGWRGTLRGITFEAVKYMSKFSKVEKAILGICICEKCYEVREDVFRKFSRDYEDCFFPKGKGKYLFSLKKANLKQLKAAGVKKVEEMELCTVCNNDMFFSFRKEKTEKRNLFAIRLK